MTRKRNDSAPPAIHEFSVETTDRAVLRTTLQHPATLYPAAVGILSGIAGILLEPSLLVFGLSLGGLSLGVGSWIINYFFRGDSFAKAYIQVLSERMERHKQEALRSVIEDLKVSKKIHNAEDYTMQGIEQYNKVRQKFKNLRSLLDEKLKKGELTHVRYLGSAEQVYLSVLDNLKEVVTVLKTISAIDTDYINSRLVELEGLREPSPADMQEIRTLKERKQLRDKQFKRVSELLTWNEEALTTLDKTSTSLADMKTVRSISGTDIERARKELEELASRAHEYSSEP